MIIIIIIVVVLRSRARDEVLASCSVTVTSPTKDCRYEDRPHVLKFLKKKSLGATCIWISELIGKFEGFKRELKEEFLFFKKKKIIRIKLFKFISSS